MSYIVANKNSECEIYCVELIPRCSFSLLQSNRSAAYSFTTPNFKDLNITVNYSIKPKFIQMMLKPSEIRMINNLCPFFKLLYN